MSMPTQMVIAATPPARTRGKAILLTFAGILLLLAAALVTNVWLVARDYQEIDRVRWLIQVERLEFEIGRLEAEVSSMKSEMAVWQGSQPAIDPSFYPTAHLSYISGTMPETGLVLKRFSFDASGITLAGTATGEETVAAWLDELKAHPKLRYDWSTTRTVPSGKITTFEIRGSSKP
jgi:hypothetical protein